MSFAKNLWYVACWADDISSDEPLSRRILGEPVVLFRDQNGRPVALIDRCSHRFAPLSMGKLHGDCIECPYHGLRFSTEGECVLNPHGDGRIPLRSSVQKFPVAERYNAIWIWMGAADLADADKIPEFEFMNPAHHYSGCGYMTVGGNYLLESDNILDLSHIEFVHPLFSSPAVSQGKFSHEIAGDTVWSKREILNDVDPPDFIRKNFNVPEGPLDRWLHVHWQAPANMALYAGGVASGQPKDQCIEVSQVHWFTPETETSTHYFYAITFPHTMGEAAEAMAKEHVGMLTQPFVEEDKPLVEAQQRNLGDKEFDDMRPLILNVDAAGTAARRIIARMIKEESGASSS